MIIEGKWRITVARIYIKIIDAYSEKIRLGLKSGKICVLFEPKYETQNIPIYLLVIFDANRSKLGCIFIYEIIWAFWWFSRVKQKVLCYKYQIFVTYTQLKKLRPIQRKSSLLLIITKYTLTTPNNDFNLVSPILWILGYLKIWVKS